MTSFGFCVYRMFDHVFVAFFGCKGNHHFSFQISDLRGAWPRWPEPLRLLVRAPNQARRHAEFAMLDRRSPPPRALPQRATSFSTSFAAAFLAASTAARTGRCRLVWARP